MIIIYPGSFDPVHYGHLRLAQYVAMQPGVEQVWMMPSRRNPLKTHDVLAGDADRLAMIRLALDELKPPRVKSSDIEFSLPCPSYTINTLLELRRRYPGQQFQLLIGSDNVTNFGKWVRADEILQDFGVWVYPRPGYDPATADPAFTILDGVPQFPFSSTEVRKQIATNNISDNLLPKSILAYIKQNHLYTNDFTQTL